MWERRAVVRNVWGEGYTFVRRVIHWEVYLGFALAVLIGVIWGHKFGLFK